MNSATGRHKKDAARCIMWYQLWLKTCGLHQWSSSPVRYEGTRVFWLQINNKRSNTNRPKFWKRFESWHGRISKEAFPNTGTISQETSPFPWWQSTRDLIHIDMLRYASPGYIAAGGFFVTLLRVKLGSQLADSNCSCTLVAVFTGHPIG